LAFRATGPDQRLVTGGDDHFLPHLSAAFAQSNQADLAVAFVKTTGLRLLWPDLQVMAEAGGIHRVRVLTSDYLDITDPEALRLLLLLQESGAEVRVYTTQNQGSFHLKAYLFARVDGDQLVSGTAFIGSSNISRQALRDGLEWNYRVVYPQDSGYLEARDRFEELFANPKSIALTDSWIEAYEQRRLPPSRSVAPGSHEQEAPPEPNEIQQDALRALAETRNNGYRRGLVVLATGLGKTWLAAFDAVRMGARRILFVAHREEILNQAASTFIRILRASAWAISQAAAAMAMWMCCARRCRRWAKRHTWSALHRSTSITSWSMNSTMQRQPPIAVCWRTLRHRSCWA